MYNHVLVLALALIMVFSGVVYAEENDLMTGKISARQDVIVKGEHTGVLTFALSHDTKNVKKGDNLASYSCSGERAEITASEKRVKLEEGKYQSKKTQHGLGGLSDVEVSIARDTVSVTKAELGVKRAATAKCSVRAPFDAEVVEVFTQKGQYVTSGDPIVHLINQSTLYGQSFLSRDLWDEFQVGDQLVLIFRELGDDAKRVATVVAKPNYIYEDQRFRIEVGITDVESLTSGMLYDINGHYYEDGSQAAN